MSKQHRRSLVTAIGLGLCAVIGMFAGVGGFTFYVAKGASYLSNDPTSCTNCHIMREQYDSWQKSSHHAFATCNDCHVPHDFVGKYLTKAENGFRHSWGSTFQDFHEPIQLHRRTPPIIRDNCLRCHSQFVSEIVGHSTIDDDPVNCIRCHASVGHGANR